MWRLNTRIFKRRAVPTLRIILLVVPSPLIEERPPRTSWGARLVPPVRWFHDFVMRLEFIFVADGERLTVGAGIRPHQKRG